MQFPPNNQKDNPNGPKKTPDGQPPQQDWRRWVWPITLALFLIWTLASLPGLLGSSSGSGAAVNISYSALFEQAEAGNITQLIVREQTATGNFRNTVRVPDSQGALRDVPPGTRFSTTLGVGDNELLISTARANGAEVSFQQTEVNPILLILFQFGPFVLIIGFFIWSARRAQRQMGGAFQFGKTQAREYTVERPQVKFTDVAGQDPAKQELLEVVDFLKEPDKYIALGAKIPRGVLLIGPPGTGKTLLARAVAGEANVAFYSIAASEFVEMFVGVGASRVRDLFRRAKENAPSIVFIDEIDAVGRQRGAGLGGGHDEREQTLNQMLAEMDGFDRTESVIVMAATNRPDVLDPALLRPGRFDRQVTVALPDKPGRLAILKIHTRDKPLGSDVRLDEVARSTIGFSGADLANLANEAALNAARYNAKKIAMRHFLDAFDRIVLGTESPPLSNENERRVTAYHESGHALMSVLVPDADPVLKVTIVPRGQALGVTVFAPQDERRNYSERYLRAQLLYMLGGRAAERVVFDEVTTGAENDLRRVTSLARRMVSQFGMSDAIGPLNFGDDERQPFLGYSLSQGRSYSEETAAKIDAEVRRMIDESYEKTIRLLSQNRDKLDKLAEALMREEVIGRAEMLHAIGVEETQEDEDVNVFSGGSETKQAHALANGGSEHTPAIVDAPPAEPATDPEPSASQTPPDAPNRP